MALFKFVLLGWQGKATHYKDQVLNQYSRHKSSCVIVNIFCDCNLYNVSGSPSFRGRLVHQSRWTRVSECRTSMEKCTKARQLSTGKLDQFRLRFFGQRQFQARNPLLQHVGKTLYGISPALWQ